MKEDVNTSSQIPLAILPKAGVKKQSRVLTQEEQTLFLKYAKAKDSYLYNFFALALRTGMRNGELRGLKYSDIDKKKMQLPNPIKVLGTIEVPIRLHTKVTAKLKVIVKEA